MPCGRCSVYQLNNIFDCMIHIEMCIYGQYLEKGELTLFFFLKQPKCQHSRFFMDCLHVCGLGHSTTLEVCA